MKDYTMTYCGCISILFLSVLIFSCKSSSSDNTSDVTQNYNLITTAIRTSKKSRLEFQNKFSILIDSFFVNDSPLVSLDESKRLLEIAKSENRNAENVLLAANEIDNELRYKEKAVDMFKLLDNQYAYNYPEIFKIMESQNKNKKNLIGALLVPTNDSLKVKARDVMETAKFVIKKYDIKLVEVK